VVYNPAARARHLFVEALVQAIEPIDLDQEECVFTPRTPLTADITMHMPRPQNHFQRNRPRVDAFLRPEAVNMDYIRTPDVDNLAKFVLDGMQGVVYTNDSYITCLRSRKVYDNVGQCNGRTTVVVTRNEIV